MRTSAFSRYRPSAEEDWAREQPDPKNNDDPTYFITRVSKASFGFNRSTGDLRMVYGHSESQWHDVREALPKDRLLDLGRRAAEELRPGAHPYLTGQVVGSRYHVEARRVVHGRPVDDFVRIQLDPETGLAVGAFLEPPIDADTLGGARILDLESLRGFAWRYVTLMGAQAEITLDEVRIAVSPETERHPRGYPVDESYMALARAGRGIPMFRLEIEDEYRRVLGFYLDARNGATVFSYVWEPFGGTPRAAAPVPRHLTLAGRKEGGEVSPTTVVGKAEGAPVLLVRGRTVFRAVFDAAANVVWIGRAGQERAYRPNADLRKALTAEIERRTAHRDRP